MRPLGPLPTTSLKLIPNSLASFLVAGPECIEVFLKLAIGSICFTGLISVVSFLSSVALII